MWFSKSLCVKDCCFLMCNGKCDIIKDINTKNVKSCEYYEKYDGDTFKDIMMKKLSHVNKDFPYFYVIVRVLGSTKDEVIINHMDNLKSKIEYYEKAYDEDLKLKSCDKIRIVDYGICKAESSVKELYRLV